MWLMGGQTNVFPQNDVWYSSDGKTWTQATAHAQWGNRNDFAAVIFNDKIWVLGGWDLSAGYYNDVWYSSDGITWTKAANAEWSRRCSLSALVFDNKLWVMGGATGSRGTVNDVWYSSDGVKWTQATASAGWSKRESFGAAVYNRKMWVISGYSAKDVWYYESQVAVDDYTYRIVSPGQLLKAVGPNPFRDNIQIRFWTSQADPAAIRIFNFAGREVAVVPAGDSRGAGEYTVTWDGRTTGGAAAPNGTYFIRYEAGGSTATQTIVKSGRVR